jgi:hypothetical protein
MAALFVVVATDCEIFDKLSRKNGAVVGTLMDKAEFQDRCDTVSIDFVFLDLLLLLLLLLSAASLLHVEVCQD